MSGTYPSDKMGVKVQFESHKVELWAILVMDRDPDVLEFYDQPHTFKLRYLRKSGKQMQSHSYTPDFLVLRRNAVAFEEWKTEDELQRLAALSPFLSCLLRGEEGIVNLAKTNHLSLTTYAPEMLSREPGGKRIQTKGVSETRFVSHPGSAQDRKAGELADSPGDRVSPRSAAARALQS
jgi:hypothetical protein